MRPVVLMAGGWRARRLLLTGLLALGVVGLGAVEAHAASSLAGETLTSVEVRGSTLTGTCNDAGASINFSASGTATGPFPGTFTESGSLTTNSFELSHFSSKFTITSPAGTVTGSKSLDTAITSSLGCGADSTVEGPNIATTYTATVNGTQLETGSATVSIAGGLNLPRGLIFTETFAPTGAVQLTGKEQCKNGGWQSFGFKNQGDCISFLATGGKNQPSGAAQGSPPFAGQAACAQAGGTFVVGGFGDTLWQCNDYPASADDSLGAACLSGDGGLTYLSQAIDDTGTKLSGRCIPK